MTNAISESIGQNPCLNCPGHCCSRNLINVCGHDVWVIARTLNVHPSDFVGLAELDEEGPYNFRMDDSESAYCLVLNMKEVSGDNRRCIFALELPNNVVRCGIYSLRPIACRAYPLAFADEEVIIKPWAFCGNGAWDTSQFDQSYWSKELGRHDMEFSIYAYVVAAWNSIVKKQLLLERPDFQLFFSFLLDFYQRLESGRSTITEEEWPSIWQQWRQSTSQKCNPLFLKTGEAIKTNIWDTWLRSIKNAAMEAYRNLQLPVLSQSR